MLHEAPEQAAGSQTPATEEADEEEPETMPLLARKVMAGRQSIIPGHQKVHVQQDIWIISSDGLDLQASHGARILNLGVKLLLPAALMLRYSRQKLKDNTRSYIRKTAPEQIIPSSIVSLSKQGCER